MILILLLGRIRFFRKESKREVSRPAEMRVFLFKSKPIANLKPRSVPLSLHNTRICLYASKEGS